MPEINASLRNKEERAALVSLACLSKHVPTMLPPNAETSTLNHIGVEVRAALHFGGNITQTIANCTRDRIRWGSLRGAFAVLSRAPFMTNN